MTIALPTRITAQVKRQFSKRTETGTITRMFYDPGLPGKTNAFIFAYARVDKDTFPVKVEVTPQAPVSNLTERALASMIWNQYEQNSRYDLPALNVLFPFREGSWIAIELEAAGITPTLAQIKDIQERRTLALAIYDEEWIAREVKRVTDAAG